MATGRSPRRDWLFVSFGDQRLLVLVNRLIGRAQELFEKVQRAVSQAVPKLGASLRRLPREISEYRLPCTRALWFCQSCISQAAGVGAKSGRALIAHPAAFLILGAGLVPIGYVLYCILTLPADGGLAIEPTPSALVVEARNGQVFATRGVFKGENFPPRTFPLSWAGRSWRSRIGTSMSTADFICRPSCELRTATSQRERPARAGARLLNSLPA
jgi:hypothetical protein